MAQANTLRVCLVHPTLVLWPAYVCIPGDKTLLGALSAARLSICSTSYSVTVVPTMHSRHNVILPWWYRAFSRKRRASGCNVTLIANASAPSASTTIVANCINSGMCRVKWRFIRQYSGAKTTSYIALTNGNIASLSQSDFRCTATSVSERVFERSVIDDVFFLFRAWLLPSFNSSTCRHRWPRHLPTSVTTTYGVDLSRLHALSEKPLFLALDHLALKCRLCFRLKRLLAWRHRILQKLLFLRG